MRSLFVAALIAATAVVMAGSPADAAKKKRHVSKRFDPVAEYRGVRRSSTRITVRRRSYLDAGTEVYPGSMSYTDYVFRPTDYPFRAIDPTGAGHYPLPGPFELGSYHSPY